MTTSELTAVRRYAGVAVVDIVGDVNAGAEQSFDDAWTAAVDGDRPEAVILNFEQAGYINSTGIALIVGLLARGRTHGIPVRAFGLTQHYREIFEITRLADYLAITSDEQSAVRGVEGSAT